MIAIATTTTTPAEQGSNSNNAVDISTESEDKSRHNSMTNDTNPDAVVPCINPSSSSSQRDNNIYITTTTTSTAMGDDDEEEEDEQRIEGVFHQHQPSSSQVDKFYHNTTTTCNNSSSNTNTNTNTTTNTTARDMATTSNSSSPKNCVVMGPIHTNYNFESAATIAEATTEKTGNDSMIGLSAEVTHHHPQQGDPSLLALQQQQHQNQTTTTSSSLALAAGELLSNPHDIDNQRALPPELRKIFREVAQTGTCSSLQWNNVHPNAMSSTHGGGDGGGVLGERSGTRRSIRSEGGGGEAVAGSYNDSRKKRPHGFKRKQSPQQQLVRNNSGDAVGYATNRLVSSFSSTPVMDDDGGGGGGGTGISDQHPHVQRQNHPHFKRVVVDSFTSASSAVVKTHINYDRANNGTHALSTDNNSCEDNRIRHPNNNSLEEYPNTTDDIISHHHHPIGHQLTTTFSDFTNTNHPSTERKRRRHHRHNHRDAVCWSSCSESISSVGDTSVVSSVRSSSPSSNPLMLVAPAPPLTRQYGTLRCAIRIAVELVLNYSYNRGGYKMSTAEVRMFDVKQQQQQQSIIPSSGNNTGRGSNDNIGNTKGCATDSPTISNNASSPIDAAFIQRKAHLLQMLGESANENASSSLSPNSLNAHPFVLSNDPVIKNDEETRFITKNTKLFTLETEQAAPFSPPSAEMDRDRHNFRIRSGNMCDASVDSSLRRNENGEKVSRSDAYHVSNFASGPPFTIQRIAEVLLEPERYYSQTHKLCNALEKLLLVTSPSSAFGGFTGGNTSQNQREEREITAWLNEKGRVETEEQQRRLKRRVLLTPPDCTDPVLQMNVRVETSQTSKLSPNLNNLAQSLNFAISNDVFGSESSTNAHIDSEHQELAPNPLLDDTMMMVVSTGPVDDLESAARLSLRQKFVSVHMDQPQDGNYSSSTMDGDITRNSSDSFPPESLAVEDGSSNGRQTDPSLSKDSLSEKVTHALRGQKDSVSATSATQQLGVSRPLSPIVFSPTVGLLNRHHHQPDTEIHGHHTAGLESVTRLDGHRVEMEILLDSTEAGGSPTSGGHDGVGSPVIADLEQVEQGRSSASNSDADSDTDVSLDDSASDRSDGSDSGSCTGISEPFTAARVMALNRMNQQHRREQYLQNRALGQSYASGMNYLTPSDLEYQSGDSIDSLMAEDSGGSDSSSSDLAD